MFLHASRRQMQEIFKKACGPILHDLLDAKQLTIACHRPANLRDLLILSKLTVCENETYTASYQAQELNLNNTINAIDYETIRELDIKNEESNVNYEINRINQLTKKASNRHISYNPYTKKHFWCYLNNQQTANS